MTDPSRNIPSRPMDMHRGSRFSSLLKFGLTQEAFVVMMKLSNIMYLVECHLRGFLKNEDLFAIQWMRFEAQHQLLSLPTGAVLIGAGQSGANSFYECCRLSAILFTRAVLFPMPRWTGVPQRLIKNIKQCVDQTHLAALISEASRSFFIWVLMLTGVAAAGLPERQWAEEMLSVFLVVQGVTRWTEIKKIVESFLWLDSACDGGAMELWDTVAAAGGLRK